MLPAVFRMLPRPPRWSHPGLIYPRPRRLLTARQVEATAPISLYHDNFSIVDLRSGGPAPASDP